VVCLPGEECADHATDVFNTPKPVGTATIVSVNLSRPENETDTYLGSGNLKSYRSKGL